MNACMCANCIRKACHTQETHLSIEFPRNFTSDYQYEYQEKQVPKQEDLKIKLNTYKSNVPNLFKDSLYKNQYRQCKYQRVQKILQPENIFLINSSHLDNETTYKRTFRNCSFHDKSQPIKPVDLNMNSAISMKDAKSTYRFNYGLRQFQFPLRCKAEYRVHSTSEWDKNIESQYKHFHTLKKPEIIIDKIKPQQNQLFIKNYEKRPQSQYKRDYTSRFIRCLKTLQLE